LKILIIQTSFIGDVVLATGILEKLHAFFPEAKINFLVRKGNETLFTGHPFLNRVLVWNKKKRKYRNLFRLIKEIRSTNYDKVINLQRFAASGLLAGLSGAKEILGYDKNPLSYLFTKSFPHIIGSKNENGVLHEIERNQVLIAGFTDAKPCKPKLYPSIIDFENVNKYEAAEYITIAPASVWFTKQFPKDKWVEFILALKDNGTSANSTKIYLLGGKNDVSLCEEIVMGAKYENIEILAGKLGFLETTALMKGAKMNFTNDSAPMHFASSVNAPVSAIFCSTIPEFGFGPLSDDSHIIQEQEHLICRPCGLHGRHACPLSHFKCAYDIPVSDLVALC
jgi:heptosyltransferase-2